MNHSSRHLRNRESGVALVAALAMLFTAGLLVTALVAVSQTSTQGIYTQTELMRSGYIAEGAGNRIRYLIEADRQLNNTRRAEDVDFDEYDYDRYLADNTEHLIDYHGIPVRFRITNAVSGIALRTVSSLDALSYGRETETAVTDTLTVFSNQLADYIDNDDDTRDDSLEQADYDDLGKNNLPRNSSPQFREELQWLPAAAELLPNDRDGRPSLIRLFGVDQNTAPSIYTANYALLRTVGKLEEEAALEVLDALEEWKQNRTPLGDKLDELTLPQLQQNFSWNESQYYTVTIRQAAPDGRPTGRLSYTFRADGVAGPSDGVATYYEYIRF